MDHDSGTRVITALWRLLKGDLVVGSSDAALVSFFPFCVWGRAFGYLYTTFFHTQLSHSQESHCFRIALGYCFVLEREFGGWGWEWRRKREFSLYPPHLWFEISIVYTHA